MAKGMRLLHCIRFMCTWNHNSFQEIRNSFPINITFLNQSTARIDGINSNSIFWAKTETTGEQLVFSVRVQANVPQRCMYIVQSRSNNKCHIIRQMRERSSVWNIQTAFIFSMPILICGSIFFRFSRNKYLLILVRLLACFPAIGTGVSLGAVFHESMNGMKIEKQIRAKKGFRISHNISESKCLFHIHRENIRDPCGSERWCVVEFLNLNFRSPQYHDLKCDAWENINSEISIRFFRLFWDAIPFPQNANCTNTRLMCWCAIERFNSLFDNNSEIYCTSVFDCPIYVIFDAVSRASITCTDEEGRKLEIPFEGYAW